MNNKIIISISVTIAITIIAFTVTQNEIFENKTVPALEQTTGIKDKMTEIEQDRIKNEKSENPYIPKERDWISSGPFKLDRSEYVLGEKIFVNLDYMDKNTKGQMIFSKIINDTHSYQYKKINFDGSKPQQNFYIGMNLNQIRGICNTDQLIGNWELIFEGTNYESIKFKVLNKILPGSERNFVKLC